MKLLCFQKGSIDVGKAYDAINISSGNRFVHETESQVILSGSYYQNFTMKLVCKHVGLSQKKWVDIYGIKTDLSEKIVKIFEQGKTKYGSKA